MKKIIKHKYTHKTLYFILKVTASVIFSLLFLNWWNQYTFKKRIRENSPKIVMVTTPENGGTGFHVKAKSGKVYIVTNYHVCNNEVGKNVIIIQNRFYDRGQANYPPISSVRQIVKIDKKNDLCAIEPVISSYFEVAPFYEDSKIYTLNHSNLNPLIYMEGNTMGIISLLGIDMIATNLRVTNGASGSPILNMKDQVLGVITAVDIRNTLFLAGAISTETLINFLSDL